MGGVELREVVLKTRGVAQTEPDRKVAGELYKLARERLKMDQEDVAELVGVSVSTVSNWERGKTSPKNRLAALRSVLRMDDDDATPRVVDTPPTVVTDLTRMSDNQLWATLRLVTAEVERRYTDMSSELGAAAAPPGSPAADIPKHLRRGDTPPLHSTDRAHPGH